MIPRLGRLFSFQEIAMIRDHETPEPTPGEEPEPFPVETPEEEPLPEAG